MKKSLVSIFGAALISSTLCFGDGNTFAEISLATPIQLPSSEWSVRGFRLNLLYGMSQDVMGLDLGLVGYTKDDFIGLSLSLANWVGGDFVGAQISGVGNVVEENIYGLQLSPLVNVTKDTVNGFQASLINRTGTMNGVQLGGLNWNVGDAFAFQSGVFNFNFAEFYGWSIGGINCTDKTSGAQIGVVNLATSSASGVQIGVINAASSMSGIQIGALNLIADAPIPVFPVVNGNF